MTEEKTSQLKLNYPLTFLIGFGFLASSLAWAVYNAQVPLILDERFLMSRVLIGTIMTIDNFFGVILQPLIGVWSDNTRTRFGRRLPWITIGIPLCAILFALIPLQQTLFRFMLLIIAFNIIMALWRSPVVSIMPDVTPSPLRSEANGIINLMGGFGAIIALYVGGLLSDIGEFKFYPFLMASFVMLLALFFLLIFVREPDSVDYRKERGIAVPNTTANRWIEEAQEQFAIYQRTTNESSPSDKGSLVAFQGLSYAKKRSLIALLIAIFSWFLGNNAIETFFTLFATKTFLISGGEATMMLAGFSLSFLTFAIPAGKLARKIGRKKTITMGVIGFLMVYLLIILFPTQFLLQILLFIAGGLWAMINISSLPMVLEFASEETIGSFTGYYYLFSFSASIVSPILYGLIQDIFHTDSLLFVFAFVCFLVALVSMSFVQHGEVGE